MRKPVIRLNSAWVVVGLAVLLAAAVALVVTLTSSSPRASEVSQRLLTTADLPLGWSATISQSSSIDLPRNACLSTLTVNPTKHARGASSSFIERSGLPAMGEYLSKGPTVASEYASAVRALATCHALTFTQDKHTYRATISPITLASVGSGSAAYALQFAVGGLSVSTDIALFHTTSYLGELVYSDSAPPLAATVEALEREAAAKAEGKSPAVATTSIVSVRVRIARTSMGDVGYRMIGSGPPLILIMGYGGTMEVWDPQFVDALSQHHTVVIFDNAGVGESTALPSPLTIDAMANQTAALIKALGLERPDVLGWSMGGMIAQALAVEHPSLVGRLVLCATFPGTGTVKPSQLAINDLKSTSSTRQLSVLFPSNQAAAKESFTIAIGDYQPSSLTPSAVVNGQTNAVDKWFNGLDMAGTMTADIQSPTLVADGVLDRLDPTANDHRLAALIPHARLLLYPDAGHAFLFQDETSFVPVVDAFLSGA